MNERKVGNEKKKKKEGNRSIKKREIRKKQRVNKWK